MGKKILSIILSSIILLSLNAFSVNASAIRHDELRLSQDEVVTRQDIVNEAYSHLGIPYKYGGVTPAGFDDSGFTMYVYEVVTGIKIGRTTYAQRYQGVSVAKENLEPGDLVFTSNYGHVGIYVGDGKYVHSPQTGDVVKVSDIYNFVEGRRIINTSEPNKVEDINKDGEVNILDLSALSVNYNKKNDNADYKLSDDMNTDGIIDLFDLVTVAKSMK